MKPVFFPSNTPNWLFLGICLFALFFASTVQAQAISDASVAFNEQRIQLNKQAMLVLGGWATTNMIVGGIWASQSQGTRKHFHQMNAYWNTVNLAIAGFGYYQATKEIPSSIDLANTVEQQYAIQQALLFNAGLDVAYLMGGFYLIERSKSNLKNQERLKGFGQSVLLQGGFLLAFDITVYLIHQSHQPALKSLLSHVHANAGGIGLYWRI